MASAERASASFQVQLKAAFQQIRTLQAENLRLQSTSFRLEAALQQFISKDLVTTAHSEQANAASLCTTSDSNDSMQQPMFVVGADRQFYTTAEGTQGLEDTTPLGRLTLELLSGLSSNDSVSFVPIVAFTTGNNAPEKAPGCSDSKVNIASTRTSTEEPQDAVAAALLATVPSARPLQPPTPPVAVVSPFAAYSHRAFSDCSSAEPNQPVPNKALLSFGSDNSTAADLLTVPSVTQARHLADAWTVVGRMGGPSRCDHDKLCHSLSSTVSASSLVGDSTDYRPEGVCVVQRERGMGRYTLAVWQKGDDRKPQRHRVLKTLATALGMCFCRSAGSAL